MRVVLDTNTVVSGFIFITQAKTSPPSLHLPRQFHRFLSGETNKDGVSSSWNGQRPRHCLPAFFSATPDDCTSRSREISLFSRSISDAGILAMSGSG